MNLHDKERAKSFLDKGLAALKKDQDKEVLKKVYADTVTRLEPEPAWLTTEKQQILTPPDLSGQAPVDEPDGLTKRRFHAGGVGTYVNPNESKFLDFRKKIAYKKLGK
jgi:hypothetical protein